MKFISLRPFIPSGSEFQKSKELFKALGFDLLWEEGDYAGFGKDESSFILQKFNNREFAENFMITVRIDNAKEFRDHVLSNKIPERFGIKIGEITDQPYGKEVNIIDLAGVCWHFVE